MQRGALILLALLVLLGGLAAPARAQTGGATVTVIAGQVQVQAADGTEFAPARDGQSLAVGARVRTGGDGRATLTFFDGTTATLDPHTEVVVERMDPTPGGAGGLLITLQLSAGRVWSQVTSLFDRGSSFEVRAAGASAVAREGTFGYRVDADGTLACWAIAGTPLVLRRAGEERLLMPGEQVVVPPTASLPAATPRQFGSGVLEVRTEGALLARLVNPAGLTVGFPLGELVVNQILDATTSTPGAPNRWIRVPGPLAGPYALLLQPEANGPYIVRVTLERDGRELANHEWRGEARLGEVLVADLVVEASGAAPTGLEAGEPQTLTGQPPGNFMYP